MPLNFSDPGLLYVIPAALAVVTLLWWQSFRWYQRLRRVYGDRKLVNRHSSTITLGTRIRSLVLLLAAVTLFLGAMAGPQVQMPPQQVESDSLNVVVAFDVSPSMAAEDYRNSIPDAVRSQFIGAHGSRLDEAKYIVTQQLMSALSKNKMGLVTYRGDGFPQADATDDFDALRFILSNWVTIGSAPGGGSDYARGLQTAIDMLERDSKPGTGKVIVLFSDGGFTGDPAMLAKVVDQLKSKNITLVILGLGLGTPVPLPQYDSTGKFLGYYKVDGKTATTSIEEAPMIQLATASGGTYIHLDPNTQVNINWPSAVGRDVRTVPRNLDIYQYPLAASLLLFFLLCLNTPAGWRAILFGRAKIEQRKNGKR